MATTVEAGAPPALTMARQRQVEGSAAIRRIVASYDNLVIRLYSRIRFTILRQPFLEEIGQYLPDEGDVLDLGCGFGLFSLYFATLAPGRRLAGVDIDAGRIRRAQASADALGVPNAEYEACDVLRWGTDRRFDAIYMLDLLHHLPAAQVPGFLAAAASLLKPGGTLLLKEVAPTPRWKMWFTLLLDRLMVGMDPIRYWPPAELQAVLRDLGFDVKTHRMTDVLPYPHSLYVCRRQG